MLFTDVLLTISFFIHKLFWLKTRKTHKNVVAVNVLQHFNIEYALTKFVLQYEIKI